MLSSRILWSLFAAFLALPAVAPASIVDPLGVSVEDCSAPSGEIVPGIPVGLLCDLRRLGALDPPIEPVRVTSATRAGSFNTVLRLQLLAAVRDALDPTLSGDLFNALRSGDFATFDAAIPDLLAARREPDRRDALNSALLGSTVGRVMVIALMPCSFFLPSSGAAEPI